MGLLGWVKAGPVGREHEHPHGNPAPMVVMGEALQRKPTTNGHRAVEPVGLLRRNEHKSSPINLDYLVCR
jgi:hypothetical protein